MTFNKLDGRRGGGREHIRKLIRAEGSIRNRVDAQEDGSHKVFNIPCDSSGYFCIFYAIL